MTVATYGSTLRTAVVEGLEFAYHEEGEGEPLIMLHGSGPGVSAWSKPWNVRPCPQRPDSAWHD